MPIYTKVADDGGKWVEIGAGLPGIGGWATITAVDGDYTKHPVYEDGGVDWVAYEFTGNGYFIITDGLIDTLLVAGGMWYSGSVAGSTSGGRVAAGILDLPAMTYNCEVDVKFRHQDRGNPGSSIRRATDDVDVMMAHRGLSYVAGNNEPFGSFADIANGLLFDGYKSSITGVEKEYGQGHKINGTPTSDAPGNAAQNQADAKNGAVIIRVPAAYADNVQETFHGWNNYASVENGVVVETQKLPDNQPRTLSNEWVDAPAEVSTGWIYDGSEFVPPAPPSNKELIAELEARVEELRKA